MAKNKTLDGQVAPVEQTPSQVEAAVTAADDNVVPAADDSVVELSKYEKYIDPVTGEVREVSELRNVAKLRAQVNRKFTEEIQPQIEKIKQAEKYVTAAQKSVFLGTVAEMMNRGVSEEQAIQAGLVAIGQSPQKPEPPIDPEPAPPAGADTDSPEYQKYLVEKFKWDNRQAVRQAVDPLLRKVSELEDELSKVRADQQNVKILTESERTHNRNLETYSSALSENITDYQSWDARKMQEFNNRVADILQQNGVDDSAMHAKEIHPLVFEAAILKAHRSLATAALKPPAPQMPIPSARPLQPGASGTTSSIIPPNGYQSPSSRFHLKE
jgi:hypothetical protein